MKTQVKILLFLLVSSGLIGCDRVTKDLAKEHLIDRPPVSYFHDTFRLIYVENTGAAYGLGENLSKPASFWLLSILPLGFMLILFVYAMRESKKINFNKMLALAFIFAGGVGNIADRIIFDRHVTDFMNVGIQNVRTEVFNFADVYITTGAIALLLLFRNKKVKSAT